MIKLDNTPIFVNKFPDGTQNLKVEIPISQTLTHIIEWKYDNDEEMVTLFYLVEHLKAHQITNIDLYLPYIPNARQDRVKHNKEVFTLKYFCDFINLLNFNQVKVLDPHSNVSVALLDRVSVIQPTENIKKVINIIAEKEKELPTLFYPDEGSVKRYSDLIKVPYTFGIKKRDWDTGTIQGLDISGDISLIKDKNILIIDDICSKGGTFYHSSNKLKELGAKNIYLYIIHCEDTIFKGNILDSGLVTCIYTTDSIFRKTHEKIEVLK